MTEVWNLVEMSFPERAAKAFDLIQDVADFVAFDELTCEAVLQVQGKIEEMVWNLYEDAHYYDSYGHGSFYS